MNWKTTIGSIIAVLGILWGPIVQRHEMPTVAELTAATGVFSIGWNAKDKDVTGAGLTARKKGAGD